MLSLGICHTIYHSYTATLSFLPQLIVIEGRATCRRYPLVFFSQVYPIPSTIDSIKERVLSDSPGSYTLGKLTRLEDNTLGDLTPSGFIPRRDYMKFLSADLPGCYTQERLNR